MMAVVRIGGGRVLFQEELVSKMVTVADGLIRSVSDEGGPVDIDATGLIIAPGFIDVQINGGYGLDLASDADSMWELGRRLPSSGVTGFLPTIISSAASWTQAALRAVKQRPASYRGAEPIGLHLEGPMLNPARCGAHEVRHLAPPRTALIEGWTREGGVAMVTLAPELAGAIGVIAKLSERGIVVSAGHTDADSTVMGDALGVGLTAVTHLFNAMAPMGHREPNVVGVALAEESVVAGLIVDGHHVDPVVVAAAWNAKGPDGIVLVTDAVAAMGLPSGAYELAGGRVTSDETGVRRDDGVLAGSVLTMDQAVRNLVAFTGCSAEEAITAATRTPALLIGRLDRGRVEPGALADIVLLDPALQVQATIVAGQVMFVTDGARSRFAPNLMEGL
jgi:N-acetylglucosamine-6-phosphate deacetylase